VAASGSTSFDLLATHPANRRGSGGSPPFSHPATSKIPRLVAGSWILVQAPNLVRSFLARCEVLSPSRRWTVFRSRTPSVINLCTSLGPLVPYRLCLLVFLPPPGFFAHHRQTFLGFLEEPVFHSRRTFFFTPLVFGLCAPSEGVLSRPTLPSHAFSFLLGVVFGAFLHLFVLLFFLFFGPFFPNSSISVSVVYFARNPHRYPHGGKKHTISTLATSRYFFATFPFYLFQLMR